MNTEETQEPAAVSVPAQLCTWRVYGVARSYSDMGTETGWTTSGDAGLQEGDQLHLSVGELPDEVVALVREHRASSRYLLEAMLLHQHEDLSLGERGVLLGSYASEANDAESAVRGNYSTWMTLGISRPTEVLAHPDAPALWVREDRDPLMAQMKAFGKDTADRLDLAFAMLLPVLGEDLRPERQLLLDRVYLDAPGRMAMTLPSLNMGLGHLTVETTGWDNLPFARLADAVSHFSTLPQQAGGLAGTASRWLQAALAVQGDQLRRFQFAFFGLEVLANKVGKAVESSVVEDLTAETDLPMTQLIWPAPKDADSPWRNATLRFTLAAAHLSRETAVDDVETFRELAKCRNDLAHGNATPDELDDLPASAAIGLLTRYVALVGAAFSSGSLAP